MADERRITAYAVELVALGIEIALARLPTHEPVRISSNGLLIRVQCCAACKDAALIAVG
jgi:hypothetical protein